jgi:hypothetical protein
MFSYFVFFLVRRSAMASSGLVRLTLATLQPSEFVSHWRFENVAPKRLCQISRWDWHVDRFGVATNSSRIDAKRGDNFLQATSGPLRRGADQCRAHSNWKNNFRLARDPGATPRGVVGVSSENPIEW